MVQNGGFFTVTSVISTFLPSMIWISGGRRKPFSSQRRSSGQSPRAVLRRANSSCHFERGAPGLPSWSLISRYAFHHGSPLPSIVPRPVIATFSTLSP